MAKFFVNGKWKRRAVTALSVTLCLSLSMGILSACGGNETDGGDEEEDPVATETDTQLLKNGNFEFYSDKETEREDKRTFLYSPTSWSFTSGSPSSDTRSGILNLDEFDDLTKQGREFADVADAYAHWEDENVTVYDRLKFLDEKKDDIKNLASDSEEKKLFDKYNYSMDFEDVKALSEYFAKEGTEQLAPAHATEGEGAVEDENHLLMIHNYTKTNNVVGTGQYYTSGTTITLQAGTAAEVSVWVRTDDLYHYGYDTDKTEGDETIPAEHPDGIPVENYAGAYIGVTNTVGGTTLDQMQIKNINTKGEWQKYTVYVQANTYATSTFKIVLGLGQSSSDNRYEAVNGYAFFDDVSCKILDAKDFPLLDNGNTCDLTTEKEDKTFPAACKETDTDADRTYSLDLKGEMDFWYLPTGNVTVDETTELSGNEERKAPVEKGPHDITEFTTFEGLKNQVNSNNYLKNIFDKDFEDRFFKGNGDRSDDVIMLLSASGAPFTATMKNDAFTLGPDERMLLSFFVKTSSIRSGMSGAGITLVDGVNETSISPFDSTTVNTVDVDEDTKDIYKGWVQCFFFVENDTNAEKTFSLKFTYGPTAVAGTTKSNYCDGYAAFANFEYIKDIDSKLFGYASTGTYAKKVSLTGEVTPTHSFDSASITSDIEHGFATPVSFTGVQSGSISMVPEGTPNPTISELNAIGVYTGLLNAKHQDNYIHNEWSGALPQADIDGTDWWYKAFYDKDNPSKVPNQPLVILNTDGKDENGNTVASADQPSYGYLNKTETLSANSYRKISLRVKLSANATATVYLIDTSDAKKGYNDTLKPVVPKVTYWYDDDGNICTKDPSKDDFNKRTDIAFYKEDNGLYTRAGETDGTYYANLQNYGTDGNGNKITSDETIAYYAHNGAFWAYYDKDKTGDSAYTQQVKDLQEAKGFDSDWIRYSAPADETLGKFVSSVTVKGSADNADNADNADGWTDVVFYLRTGSEQKTFRLEVWAGTRNDSEGNGLPANSYVIFDEYKSESISDYSDILSEAVAELKDNAGIADKDNLTEGALYYTFTYYDSPSYLRYDATRDEEKLGDPHGSYKQSAYSEQLIALLYGENTLFLDYSAYNVSVPEDDLGGGEEEETPEESKGGSDANVWLLIASGSVAAALVFAIVAVIVQRAIKASRKNAKPKKPKNKTKLKLVKDDSEDEE